MRCFYRIPDADVSFGMLCALANRNETTCLPIERRTQETVE